MNKRIPVKPSRAQAAWEFLNQDVDASVGVFAIGFGICALLIVIFN